MYYLNGPGRVVTFTMTTGVREIGHPMNLDRLFGSGAQDTGSLGKGGPGPIRY